MVWMHGRFIIPQQIDLNYLLVVLLTEGGFYLVDFQKIGKEHVT